MSRLVLLASIGCTACTTLRYPLPQNPASQHRLSPDSEALRRHTELELVWEQPAGRQDLITLIVDGTNRAVSQLARFSQRLYAHLAQGLTRRCPARCLDAAWRIVVHEGQPNVVVIAHGPAGKRRLEVVGVYYLGERSAAGLEALSARAAAGITKKLLRRGTSPAGPLPVPTAGKGAGAGSSQDGRQRQNSESQQLPSHLPTFPTSFVDEARDRYILALTRISLVARAKFYWKGEAGKKNPSSERGKEYS
jgi:hypothetical protein